MTPAEKPRVVSTQEEMQDLPIGTIVANGPDAGEDFIFRKTVNGKWKGFDPHTFSYSAHERWVEAPALKQFREGFSRLHLPVYVLSRSGNRAETADRLKEFRRKKKAGEDFI